MIVSELGLTKRTAPSNNLQLQSRMQTKIDDLKQCMSDVVYNEWRAIVNSFLLINKLLMNLLWRR